jgi:hypothetical protein
MSLLPMNFDAVLQEFQHPAPILRTDTVGSRIDGEWMEEETGQRFIDAIVLAMPTGRVQFFKEGDSSAAGIVLHTRETLYFTDIDNMGLERRQSYIDYQGYRFRVVGTGFMMGNANFNTYEAVRFFR